MARSPSRDLQEEFLAATGKRQETALKAIKSWVETVTTAPPRLPAVYAALGDRLPKLPTVNVPFADKLPKPEDVMASGYDFAEHVLATQRKFAEDLLKAMAPLLPGDSKVDPAAKSEPKAAVAEPAPKPAAPKVEPQAPAAQVEPTTAPPPTARVPRARVPRPPLPPPPPPH